MVIIKQNYLVIKWMYSFPRPQSSPLKALPHRMEQGFQHPQMSHTIKKKKKMKETCQGKVIIHTGVLVMESFLVKIFTQKLEHPLMGSKTNEITKERRTHCFQMWLFGISTGQRGVVCWVLVEGVPG